MVVFNNNKKQGGLERTDRTNSHRKFVSNVRAATGSSPFFKKIKCFHLLKGFFIFYFYGGREKKNKLKKGGRDDIAVIVSFSPFQNKIKKLQFSFVRDKSGQV